MKWFPLLGIVVVLAVVAPLIVGALGKRRAEREFPAEAERLGLAREGRPAAGKLGRFHGVFRDRRVVVRPDAFALVRVALESRPALSLSTDPATRNVVRDTRPFDSGDPVFDRRFPHRFASVDLAERLRADATLRRTLLDFAADPRIASLEVNAEYVSVTQKIHVFFHYIPVDGFEALLGDLVALADALEPALH